MPKSGSDDSVSSDDELKPKRAKDDDDGKDRKRKKDDGSDKEKDRKKKRDDSDSDSDSRKGKDAKKKKKAKSDDGSDDEKNGKDAKEKDKKSSLLTGEAIEDEPVELSPEAKKIVEDAQSQIRSASGSLPGWAGVLELIAPLGGQIVVLGAAAAGFYKPGQPVDLVFLSDGDTEENLKKLRGLKKARMRPDGAILNFATVDVHVHLNDFAAVVTTQLLRDYISTEPHLPRVLEQLVRWGIYKSVRYLTEAMWAWSAIVCLCEAGKLKPLRLRPRELPRKEAEERKIPNIPSGDSDTVSLPFASEADLKDAAMNPDHRLWERQPAPKFEDVETAEVMKLTKIVLEALGGAGGAGDAGVTGSVSLNDRGGFRGVEDPLTGRVMTMTWGDAVLIRREAMRDGSEAVGSLKELKDDVWSSLNEAEGAEKGDEKAEGEKADGDAGSPKAGAGKAASSWPVSAWSLSPRFTRGMPKCSMSGRKKAQLRADVKVEALDPSVEVKGSRLEARAILVPVGEHVTPWDDRKWSIGTCVEMGDGEYEVEVDLDIGSAVAEKAKMKAWVHVRDLARPVWATTNASVAFYLNCPEEEEKALAMRMKGKEGKGDFKGGKKGEKGEKGKDGFEKGKGFGKSWDKGYGKDSWSFDKGKGKGYGGKGSYDGRDDRRDWRNSDRRDDRRGDRRDDRRDDRKDDRDRRSDRDRRDDRRGDKRDDAKKRSRSRSNNRRRSRSRDRRR